MKIQRNMLHRPKTFFASRLRAKIPRGIFRVMDESGAIWAIWLVQTMSQLIHTSHFRELSSEHLSTSTTMDGWAVCTYRHAASCWQPLHEDDPSRPCVPRDHHEKSWIEQWPIQHQWGTRAARPSNRQDPTCTQSLSDAWRYPSCSWWSPKWFQNHEGQGH